MESHLADSLEILFLSPGRQKGDAVLRQRNRETEEELTPEEEDGAVEQFTPDAFIRSGDTLSIRDVGILRLPETMELDDFQDAEIRAAALQIIRADGSLKDLKTPLFFFGRNRLTDDLAGNNFYRLKSRIYKFIRYLDVDEQKRAYAIHAGRIAELLEFLLERDEKIFQLRDNSRRWLAAVRTLDLVSHAVIAGYYWAKAESSVSILPLAEKAKRSLQGASAGGKKSVATRRNKAKWIPIATAIATDFRRERPDASQEKVADEIIGRWKSEAINYPGHSRLKKLVSELEKSGDLPKRQKRVG